MFSNMKAQQYRRPDEAEQRTDNQPLRELAPFENGYRIIVDERPNQERIQIANGLGKVEITIIMSAAGPVIRLSGSTIELQAKEQLSLVSPKISLCAEEEIHLHTKGDFKQLVEGDLQQVVSGNADRSAQVQHLVSALGDVNIKANDNVKLDGERIKLNCD